MIKRTDKFKDIISSSPLVCYLFYHRYFRRTYKFLKDSEWWNEQQIETYQLSQLKKLMDHAYTNVPYYKTLFDKYGLKPSDINTIEDLQKIPFLTKEIVRENIRYLKARNYPEYKFEYVTSGGSSGIPLGLFDEKFVRVSKSTAYFKMVLNRFDCSLYDKHVDMRGYIVISSKNKDKFWGYSLFGRRLCLSSYHMNEENLPKYIEKIRRFRPKFLITYPSSLTVLAIYMKKNNIEPFKTVKGIICLGESLYDWQRELFEETLCCKVFGSYGHAEQVASGASCEKSNYYHFFPDYGIIELIGNNGKLVKKEGEIGEIVATGLNNFICPFIRYRTGDLGICTSEKCSCGRNYPMVKNIFGRAQEYLINKDNSYMPMAAVNMHSNIFDNVRQCQFYQEKRGEAILRIVKTDAYGKEDTEKIKKEFALRLGNDFHIDIEFVDEIKKTMRGKHSYLVQKIPINIEELLSK